jgi:sugar/nucleoside kinase (ribokinase family)
MTIGGATQDIFIRYKYPEMMQLELDTKKRNFLLLEEGRKIDVSNLDYHTGGGATNSAVSFSRLGFDVRTFFKIGPDKAAEFVLQRLEHEGIDTRFIVHDTEIQTGTSFIVPCPSGDRVVLAYRGANAQLRIEEIPLDEISTCDQLYITSLTGCSSELLLPIVKHAKKHNVPVAANPGSSQLVRGNTVLRESLSYIDILILNTLEASTLMRTLAHTVDRLKCYLYKEPPQEEKKLDMPRLLQGPILYKEVCFDVHDFFKEVLSYGVQTVVVTNGAEGVYVATPEHILFHPSLPVEVVSTLGAGDAFGSTFIASLLHNHSIQEALVRGIINSTHVITKMGAKTGLLTRTELDAQFKKITTSKVRTFKL